MFKNNDFQSLLTENISLKDKIEVLLRLLLQISEDYIFEIPQTDQN